MNEKQAKRLRQAIGYKPGPIAIRGKKPMATLINMMKGGGEITLRNIVKVRKYEMIGNVRLVKTIDTDTWKDTNTRYIKTGYRQVCTGKRWRYLRLKDAIRETNRR